MSISIPLKSMLPLAGLTVSAFVFNTSEFMPIALLTDISTSFGMQPEETGIMITVYAWMVALLSLPLMLLGSRMAPKPLLLLTIGVFCTGQVVACISRNFPMLMAGRVIVAASHAVFWSIVAPLSTRLVDEKHASFALSMVATGTSVAMIFGLPLGRVIGLAVGWRMTFLLIGAASALVLLYLFIMFPRLTKEASFSLGKLPALVEKKSIYGIFIMTVFFATAYYTFYSYIEPYLGQVAHFSPEGITAALIILGVAGLLGSFLCSHMYGTYRWGVIACSGAGLVVPLLLFYFGTDWGAVEITAGILQGALNTVFSIVMQALIIENESASGAPIAMSIYSGLYNVGIGSGTFIGGRITAWGDLSYVGLAGAIIALFGAIYCLFVYLPYMKKLARRKTGRPEPGK